MDTTLPPFRPMRVQLVGHVNLGTVPARWDGPILELEDGTRYGPCAVFSAEPVAEERASRGVLVWSKNIRGQWVLTGHNIDGDSVSYFGGPPALLASEAWEDGYEVPPWPGEEPAAPVEPQPEPVPAPVGTWGGHTDWIAWGGGDRPVDRDCLVGAAFRAGGYVIGVPAGGFGWQRLGHGGDIIAYRIVQPEPAPRVDRTIYNPDDIRRGDRHTLTDGTRGTVLGVIDGWIAYSDRLPVVQHCNCIVRVEPVDPDDIPF